MTPIKDEDVLNSVMQLRRILDHPCPQNPSVGSSGVPFPHPENPLLDIYYPQGILERVENGIRINEVYYFIARGVIRHEQQGLLSLTDRNDKATKPVTRTAVVACINYLISEACIQFHILNQNKTLTAFFEKNAKALMALTESCAALTLQQLISMEISDLDILKDHPTQAAKLFDKAQIPVAEFLRLSLVTRQNLINHAVAVFTLVVNAHVSWKEILLLNPEQMTMMFKYPDQITKLIEKKQSSFSAIQGLSANEIEQLVQAKQELPIAKPEQNVQLIPSSIPIANMGPVRRSIGLLTFAPDGFTFFPVIRPARNQPIKFRDLDKHIDDMTCGQSYAIATYQHRICIEKTAIGSFKLQDVNSPIILSWHSSKEDLLKKIKQSLDLRDDSVINFSMEQVTRDNRLVP